MLSLIRSIYRQDLRNLLKLYPKRTPSFSWKFFPRFIKRVASTNTERPLAIKDMEAENNKLDHTSQSVLNKETSVRLRKLDKYVMLWFSEKGKYKSLNDIPPNVSIGQFQRAYSMQRIIGCSVTMLFMIIFIYSVIKYQKYQIANSEEHGERYESYIKVLGHDVGQLHPPRRKRDKEA